MSVVKHDWLAVVECAVKSMKSYKENANLQVGHFVHAAFCHFTRSRASADQRIFV